MRKLAIETGDAFILVYSIDDSDSFDQIRCLKDSIISEKNKIPPIVVVGNKSGLYFIFNLIINK
jgi:GTPase SAR1 family protein